jgi:hypothetical protein
MMSFWDKFESKQDGIEDTIEFTIRTAVVTLSTVILVVVLALVIGLFLPNEIVDSAAVLEMINPAFQTIIGAFVGLLGGLSLNANARDAKPEEPAPEPIEPEPEAPAPIAPPPPAPMAAPVQEELDLSEVVDENGDGILQPWEIHRNDLRWDANGDGVVDENDFPDWRNPEVSK